MLTNKRLAEIEERHTRYSDGTCCECTGEAWPCSVSLLLREVRQLREVAEAAEGIGAHLDTCSFSLGDSYPCDCGFEELNKSLAAWRGGEGEDG